MNAKEMQEHLDNPRFDPSYNFWLGEIAIQLATANELARLRLALAYQDIRANLPKNLADEINAATKGDSL
jgi:hypothetical protein